MTDKTPSPATGLTRLDYVSDAILKALGDYKSRTDGNYCDFLAKASIEANNRFERLKAERLEQ